MYMYLVDLWMYLQHNMVVDPHTFGRYILGSYSVILLISCLSSMYIIPCHRVSWKHPRSGHWHQLDLTITRTSSLNSVLITRAYHSADCDSDHSFIISKVRLKPKQLHLSKQKSRPHINTVHTSHLSKRVWENKKLTLNTKMKVYQACILSTLLYGSETWPTYSVQERHLNSVYHRHLRTIMNVTWKDHISNHDILAKGKISKPACFNLPETFAMVGACHLYGRRSDP